MYLDLFNLHNKEDKTPRKWICAIGKDLNKELDSIIDEIIKCKGKKITYVKTNKKNIKFFYKKAILKAKNQQNLAIILNVNRQQLYKWSESKERIPINVLIKLIKYINLEVDINKIIIERKHLLLFWNRQKIAKILAKKLKVSINFPEKIIYGRRYEIAIIFILELLSLWKRLLNKSDKELENKKREIQKTFEFFKQNQIKCKKIRAVKILNTTLSKIVGAMLADGSISSADSSISLTEEGRISVETFSKWVENVFGLASNVRKLKADNAWVVKIDNKPLQSYLTRIFNFSKGKKKVGYDLPQIIKDSNFEIKKACAIGVMIFDGVVRTNGEIGLNIGSKKLRDTIFDILINDKINVTKSNKSDTTGMWKLYSSNFKSKEQYKLWLNYFIKDSDKWCRIYEWINGFQGKVSNSKIALIILKKCFYKKSASKVTLADIFSLLAIYHNLTINKLLDMYDKKKIHLSEGTLWTYTKILTKMNLITKKRLNDNTNIYVYNPNVASWRLPYRPHLSSYYL